MKETNGINNVVNLKEATENLLNSARKSLKAAFKPTNPMKKHELRIAIERVESAVELLKEIQLMMDNDPKPISNDD